MLHQSYRERAYFDAQAENDAALGAQIDTCRVSYALAKLAYACGYGLVGDAAMDTFTDDMGTDGLDLDQLDDVTCYLDDELRTPSAWAAVVATEAVRLLAAEKAKRTQVAA
jgi:hypothetical protein